MTSIYRQAKEVVAWLGPESTNGTNALKIVLDGPELESDGRIIEIFEIARTASTAAISRHDVDIEMEASISSRENLLLLNESHQGLARLSPIFSLPYWTRVWVIQEIAVATSVRLVCGNVTTSWETFCHIVDELYNAAVDITEATESGFEGYRTLCHFRKLSRMRYPASLMEALQETRSSLATNPRDKVYALLGLTYDGAIFVPNPSYSVSLEDLQMSMTRGFLLTTGVLDMICIKGLQTGQLSQTIEETQTTEGGTSETGDRAQIISPSWCAQLLVAMDSTAAFEAKYVGLRETRRKFAAAGSETHFTFREAPSDKSILLVDAILFDTINDSGTAYGSSTSTVLTPSSQTSRGIQSRLTVNPYQTTTWFGYKHDGLRLAARHALCGGPKFQRFNPWAIQAWAPVSLFTQTVNPRAKFIRRRWQLFMARRFYDTPSLSAWLKHNKTLCFHGQSLENLLYSRTQAATFFMIFLIPYYSPFFLLVLFEGYGRRNHLSQEILESLDRTAIWSLCLFGILLIGGWLFRPGFFLTFRARDKLLRHLDEHLSQSCMKLITTRNGYIGFGHAHAMKGDHVVVMKGCTVPVIIRPVQDGYVVVGMAYIQGIMNGEAVSGHSWTAVKLK